MFIDSSWKNKPVNTEGIVVMSPCLKSIYFYKIINSDTVIKANNHMEDDGIFYCQG